MKTLKYIQPRNTIIAFILLIISSSCADLDVENLNNPDTQLVMSDPEMVESVAAGLFQTWYNTIHTNTFATLLSTMADQTTIGWANGGWVYMTDTSRVAWTNQMDSRYLSTTDSRWRTLYSVISQCTDIHSRIESGEDLITVDGTDNTEMLRAFSYFVSGISYGYIAAVFDKGYIINQSTDFSNPELYGYAVVMDSALYFLDKSIAICKGSSFIIPEGWLGGTAYSNLELAMLANSYAARFMVSGSRNAAQDQQVDWSRVLAYAENGIQSDFEVLHSFPYWWNGYMTAALWKNLARVNLRIINLMDPDYPKRWPADNISWDTPDGMHPGEADTIDKRIYKDFAFVDFHVWPPERGYFRYSNYVCIKFDRLVDNSGNGIIPIFLKAENDLLLAEAQVRANNDLAGALEIINQGSRTVRGEIDPLPADASYDEILEAIFYERDVELMFSGVGISFFDMRRRDMLWPGNLLHFPVPGTELQILGLEYYTYGGSSGTPGEDYSTGGWL